MTQGERAQFEYAQLDHLIALIGRGRPLEPGEFTRVSVFNHETSITLDTDVGEKIPLLNGYGAEGWQVVHEALIELEHPLSATGILLPKLQEARPEINGFVPRFHQFLLMREVTPA